MNDAQARPGFAEDLNGQERPQQTLSQGEISFRQIVESIPVPVAVTAPTGEVENLNKPTLDYFGKSFEELKGWKASDVVHPDDLERTIAAQVEAHEQGTPYNIESRHRRADGVYRWFNVVGLPLRDTSGEIVHWFHLQIDIDDRKKAEEALRQRERDLALIIDTTPALAWAAGPDGRLDYFNQHSLEYLGLTAEAAASGEWVRAVHPEDERSLGATWKSILTSGQLGEAEARLRRHDGEYRWFLFRANPLRDEAGKIVRWYGVNTDITERREAIEKLKDQQELLHLAQNAARAMAFDWQIQREVNVWSPEQEQLYGLEPGSFDGRFGSWKKLIYPADWPAVVKALETAQTTGEISAEYRVVWPDGSIHWLMARGQMFLDDDQKPRRMVGFTADVTARKLVEEELRRSEAFLAEGQHLARTGNFTWKVLTEEIMWSEQLYRIFELDPSSTVTLELIGSRVHPDDLPLLGDMVERAQRGVGDFEYEHRLLMPDGSIKHLHLIAHKTLDQGGDLEYIGAVQDVTQRRVSEQALSEARSELAQVSRVMSLGVLTASIAHEVNQPLSGIVTNASTCVRMLDADPPNIDGARETARRTIRDGNRASEVITRLRALFRRKEATVESVDLNEAALEVIALSRSELQRSQILLQTKFAKDLPPVDGDRVQLQQVILNLLLNAADAMSSLEVNPRQLTLMTESADDSVRVSVCDVGTGFGPGVAEKIFDAFYTTKKTGMGIGLSVSRSIIENHNGRLWAAANDDGHGATVCFSIPLANPGKGDRSNSGEQGTLKIQ